MTDTTAIPGVRGATRSTWRDDTHLRGLMMKLIRQHPDADRDELRLLYRTAVKCNEDLNDEAIDRVFDNDYARIEEPAKRPQRKSTTALAATHDHIKQVVLLDL